MTLNFKTAKQLLEDQHSCLKLTTVSKHISLSPKYLGNVASGIKEQLNSLIGLYSDNFQGIVIAYNNVKLQQRLGLIVDDQPNIHFDIQAEMIIFQPTIGSILKGIVNKVGRDHIGCLVHNLFNASLPRSKEPNHYVIVGQNVLLQVVKTFTHNGILSILGQFITESCDVTNSGKKSKKRKHSEDYDTAVENVITVEKINKKRKTETNLQSYENNSVVVHDVPDFSVVHDTTQNHCRPPKRMNGDHYNTAELNSSRLTDSTDDCLVVSSSEIENNSHVKKKKKKRRHSEQEINNDQFYSVVADSDELTSPLKSATDSQETTPGRKRRKDKSVSNMLYDGNVIHITPELDTDINENMAVHRIKCEK